MNGGGIERRRGRRATVRVPLVIRRVGSHEPGQPHEEITENVSLAGVYFETDHGSQYAQHDVIFASVAIPEAETRQFPFTRVTGRSRVVRVTELPSSSPKGRKRSGVAIEFGDDVTALSALPSRG